MLTTETQTSVAILAAIVRSCAHYFKVLSLKCNAKKVTYLSFRHPRRRDRRRDEDDGRSDGG